MRFIIASLAIRRQSKPVSPYRSSLRLQYLASRARPVAGPLAAPPRCVIAMFQTLFHIPREIAGWPTFGFGLFLWLWLAICAAHLTWTAKQFGWREAWGNAPLMATFAAALAFLFPRMCDESGLPIRGYGALVAAAVVAATGMGAFRAKRFGFSTEMVFSLATWMFVPGVLGARLLYVAEYFDEFRGATVLETALNCLKLTEGGLVVYGSVLGALAGTLAFVWKYGVPLAPLLDLIAPSAALAMGVGRVGCFLNGCCFGGATDLPWAVQFPFGSPPFEQQAARGDMALWGIRLEQTGEGPAVIGAVEPDSPAAHAGLAPGQVITAIGPDKTPSSREAWSRLLAIRKPSGQLAISVSGAQTPRILALPNVLPRSRPIHPTQLYSAVDGTLLAAFLLAVTPFRRRDGEVFAAFLVIYASTRFLLEIIRSDEASLFGTGLTISQNVSVLVLAGGILWWVYVRTRGPAPRALA